MAHFWATRGSWARYGREHNENRLVQAVLPWIFGAWEYHLRVTRGMVPAERWATPEYRLVSYYVSYLPTPHRLALPAPG